jgi:hypothetical protein
LRPNLLFLSKRTAKTFGRKAASYSAIGFFVAASENPAAAMPDSSLHVSMVKP